jgi:hypothetical protein
LLALQIKYFDDNKETLHLNKERIKLQNNMAVDKWGEPLPRPSPATTDLPQPNGAKAPAGTSKAKASSSSKTVRKPAIARLRLIAVSVHPRWYRDESCQEY